MTFFALVHGGAHGGWCWERLIPELESLGHQCSAPDLPFDDLGPNTRWEYDFIDKIAPTIVSRTPAAGATSRTTEARRSRQAAGDRFDGLPLHQHLADAFEELKDHEGEYERWM